MNLGIPKFTHISDVVSLYPYVTYILALDPDAGQRRRYSVLEVKHNPASICAIGRELSLPRARKVIQTAVKEAFKP